MAAFTLQLPAAALRRGRLLLLAVPRAVALGFSRTTGFAFSFARAGAFSFASALALAFAVALAISPTASLHAQTVTPTPALAPSAASVAPTVPIATTTSARIAAKAAPAPNPLPPPTSAGALLQELRSLRELGTVLYIAAHPDDENTRLLAYLALGRGYRTGYLSLTRGDGGQNLIGSELREGLGLIRTHELLAARRTDGARQFFTRANDFGFSKTPEETLALWDRAAVLGDMVRVIRAFRPDVLVARFPTDGSGGHGHHTASALLTLDAFTQAADPAAYPEQLAQGLTPWQAQRVLWNTWAGNRRPAGADDPGSTLLRLDIGGYQPLLGESFGEIAARSRTMHKSQGFGTVGTRGTALEYFQVLAGAPATADLMDGIDTTWARTPGGTGLTARIDALVAAFDPLTPAASVPALLDLRTALAALPDATRDPVVTDRRSQLDRVIVGALGLHVETTAPVAEVLAGEPLNLRHTVLRRARVPAGQPDVTVRWRAVRHLATGATETIDAGLPALAPDQPAVRDVTTAMTAGTPPTHPYWLRTPGTTGLFRVDDPALIGRPENPPTFPVEHVFELSVVENSRASVATTHTLTVPDAAVQIIDDPVRGEIRRALAVVPPVTLAFPDDLALFAPGATREVGVELTATRADQTGNLELAAPAGWSVAPAAQPFSLGSAGTRQRFTFRVTAPAQPATAKLAASAVIGGVRHAHRRQDIRYDHIPAQLLQPPAELKAVALDVAIRGSRIGYLPGAGDLVAESLARLGYVVTPLTGADLTLERLAAFDAVVLGIRAFNTRTDLVPQLPALHAWVEAGGTLVVQYNTTADLPTAPLAPFPLTLSRARTTDETAPVRLLAPDHPALTTPNRITAADFTGWVQERGLYYPGKWDERLTPLLEMADPGEAPTQGALLVGQHGRGWFVYTGLSFFRELPEGVPGAYRLFANLVSLGR